MSSGKSLSGSVGGFSPPAYIPMGGYAQQYAPYQPPSMAFGSYNPTMDIYGSMSRVMQPMPNYYSQFAIPGGYQSLPPANPSPQPYRPPVMNFQPFSPAPFQNFQPFNPAPVQRFQPFNSSPFSNFQEPALAPPPARLFAEETVRRPDVEPRPAVSLPPAQPATQPIPQPQPGGQMLGRSDGLRELSLEEVLADRGFQMPEKPRASSQDIAFFGPDPVTGRMRSGGSTDSGYYEKLDEMYAQNPEALEIAKQYNADPTKFSGPAPAPPIMAAPSTPMPILDNAKAAVTRPDPGFGGYDRNIRNLPFSPFGPFDIGGIL